ncbi:hypothetical protein [Bradyrhizobium iriomotense]|uniref:hypothetical protein n=1 Tax=Bradyrhizobium iriomotense TaxID=441950 RepID=UPI001FEAE4A6|nr:hypothetical protein [Bradyrhizobium iriomotense]
MSDLLCGAKLSPMMGLDCRPSLRARQMISQPDSVTPAAAARVVANRLALQCLGLLLATKMCLAGVLSPADLKRVEDLRPMFAGLMADLVQTSKRTDIPAADADCVKATVQDLAEISQELSSFEYLITIEKELTSVGDNDPTRDVVKFAIEQSTNILTSQRRKIAQLPDQCARSALGLVKAQQAIQVIDATTGILSSIRSRL